MKNKQQIIWKDVSIEATTTDGVVAKGVLLYWAKEYKVLLKEPYVMEAYGSHLMYAAPVKYTTDEVLGNTVKGIEVIPLAKKLLLSMYEECRDKTGVVDAKA